LKALVITIVVIGLIAGLGLLIRSRIVPTRHYGRRDSCDRREAWHIEGWFVCRFHVYVTAVTRGDAVNLQYSVEPGKVGLDWVLLGQTNTADKDRLAAFAAQLGHPMSGREMNKVRYLRTEGVGLDQLGTSIIVEFYGLTRTSQLELITEGFEWPPKM
jgi:hypothetical protein